MENEELDMELCELSRNKGYIEFMRIVNAFRPIFFKTSMTPNAHGSQHYRIVCVHVGSTRRVASPNIAWAFVVTIVRVAIQIDYRKHATNRAHLTLMFCFLKWVPQFSSFGI